MAFRKPAVFGPVWFSVGTQRLKQRPPENRLALEVLELSCSV
jgi:hypothetical protein